MATNDSERESRGAPHGGSVTDTHDERRPATGSPGTTPGDTRPDSDDSDSEQDDSPEGVALRNARELIADLQDETDTGFYLWYLRADVDGPGPDGVTIRGTLVAYKGYDPEHPERSPRYHVTITRAD